MEKKKNNEKAVLWLRVSTEQQELESQKKDLVEKALEEGYLEENLIFLEGFGASAIKQDEKYKKEVEDLYSLLEKTPEISTVFAWEVSRLARIQSILVKLGEFLAEKKINLIILEPSIRLLDKNGDIDPGEELKLSLLSTLSTQEMRIKKARMNRGREKNRKEGKFNGGAYGALYGYQIDQNGYIIPDPSEAHVIQEIYSLYSTGKYSIKTLSRELQERGYRFRGRKVSDSNVNNILKNTAYIGFSSTTDRKYTPIIEQDLWDAVQKVKEDKDLGIQKTKESRNTYLSTKILKCKSCGSNYVATKGKYFCYRRSMKHRFSPEDQCKETVGISIEVMDGILWEVGKEQEILAFSSLNEKEIPKIEYQIEVLQEKFKTASRKVDQMNLKRERVLENYENLEIDRGQKDKKLSKIKEETFSLLSTMGKYKSQEQALRNDLLRIKLIQAGELNILPDLSNKTDKEKKEIIMKHVLKATIERIVDNGRKAIKINIELIRGGKETYIYYYTLKQKSRQIKRVK